MIEARISDAQSVLVLGGGFGGIKVALGLAGKAPRGTRISIMADKPYFEYSPSLYRVAASLPPLGVCVPLADLFERTRVELILDKAADIDLETKVVKGLSGRTYRSDFLVLALGSEVNYHGLQLLKSMTFSLKSIVDSLRLHRHLHQCMITMNRALDNEKLSLGHILVVGGGPTGTELAGELAIHAKRVSRELGLDSSYITIDIIDSGRRLVKTLPPKVSEKIQERLRKLGVNILLNRRIEKQDIEEIYLRDMHLKTNTVIWTAGVSPSQLYSTIRGLALDDKGRVLVDKYLQAKDRSDIFAIGDGASDPYSGTAQTAIHHGSYVAKFILDKINGRRVKPYKPEKTAFAIPIGPGWAAVLIGPLTFYGRLGWLLRRLGDLRFFLSIMPLKQSLLLLLSKKDLNSLSRLEPYIESAKPRKGHETLVMGKPLGVEAQP